MKENKEYICKHYYKKLFKKVLNQNDEKHIQIDRNKKSQKYFETFYIV